MLSPRILSVLLMVTGLLVCSSCDNSVSNGPPPENTNLSTDYGYGYGDGYGGNHEDIKFLDSAESNGSKESKISNLSFTTLDGESVKVSDLAKDENLILVIIRGHTREICPYCSTQTSRLISNYDKFAKRNAEVVVVYPIEQQADAMHWDAFMKSTREKLKDSKVKVPFPVLLDVELKSVLQLGIKKDLSKPATYILDKAGQVQFAYVGSTIADRPSIKAMLDQLDRLQSPSEQPETKDKKKD